MSNQDVHHPCDSLALAVINDGATYDRRKRVTREWVAGHWSNDYCLMQYFDMCARESKRAHYEGVSFSRDVLWCAASQVHDYMLTHYAESRNGADWS